MAHHQGPRRAQECTFYPVLQEGLAEGQEVEALPLVLPLPLPLPHLRELRGPRLPTGMTSSLSGSSVYAFKEKLKTMVDV